MHISKRGDIAHGIGGGRASVNNTPFSPGAVGGWLDADNVAFTNGNNHWKISSYNIHNGNITELSDFGANKIFASNLVVAWELQSKDDTKGIYSNTGFRKELAGLYNIGRDGSIIYKPIAQAEIGQVGASTWIREENGNEWKLSDDIVEYIHYLSNAQCVWVRGKTVFSYNTPPILDSIEANGITQFCICGGNYWICYWSEKYGIVLHPFNSAIGYTVVPRGVNAWHSIREMSSTIIRIALSNTDGEQPGDVSWVDYDVVNNFVRSSGDNPIWKATARHDVYKTEAPPTPIIVIPPLIEEPIEPEDNMEEHFDVVEDAFDKFLKEIPQPRPVLRALPFIQDILSHLQKEKYGYVTGPIGGENIAILDDGTPVRISRICHPNGQLIKVLNNAPDGGPQWVKEGIEKHLYYPFASLTGEENGPVPDSTEDNSTIEQLKKEIAELKAQLATKVSYGDKIGLQTNDNFFLCVEGKGIELDNAKGSVKEKGNVNATRHGLGDWEQLKVVKS